MRALLCSLALLSLVQCTKESIPSEKPNYLAKAEPVSGRKVYESNSCIVCHSLDGKLAVGPTFKGLYGTTVELDNGSKVKADEAYLREHILEPGKKVRKGFPAVMPKPSLTAAEVDALIDFIKSLA